VVKGRSGNGKPRPSTTEVAVTESPDNADHVGDESGDTQTEAEPEPKRRFSAKKLFNALKLFVLN